MQLRSDGFSFDELRRSFEVAVAQEYIDEEQYEAVMEAIRDLDGAES